ncbi:hypothetical protein [Halodesulfovibrio spirochaetisodalis]|uniref:Flagellar protein FliT n=1 Tax=Halodesulfovibrio spirochaetisodalis TaxID=1560234 RepID=A0A1B7XE27_9BACT|nr:hypothetical protein [Halodesulfovibrio spirochaetisodalis]OBQ52408.1 hypothetical protein SP90_07475 [Halodesulfovibrio spirochaetisodalis]
MANSLTLLDEALRIGEQELEALKNGDMDVADEAAVERERLISEAWALRTGDIESELRQKLLKMQNVQLLLTDELKKLHASLKSQLLASKQKSSGYNGYQKSVTIPEASISHYVDKQG